MNLGLCQNDTRSHDSNTSSINSKIKILESFIMQDYQKIRKLIEAGTKVKVKKEEKDHLYNMFVGQFESGNYDSAQKIIETLILLEPSNFIYLKSIASTHQQQKDYMQAFIFYNYAYILDKDENCLYYMANCLVELNEFDQAQYQINKLLRVVKNPQLLSRAQILARYIEKQLAIDK